MISCVAGEPPDPTFGHPLKATTALPSTNSIAAHKTSEPAVPSPAMYARVARTAGVNRQLPAQPLAFSSKAPAPPYAGRFMVAKSSPAFKRCLSRLATFWSTMPAPKSFGRDRGLQIRMLATMFLLGLIYVVLIAVLIAAGVGAVDGGGDRRRAVPGAVLQLRQARAARRWAPTRSQPRRPPSCTPRSSVCASRPISRCRASRSPTRRCRTRSRSAARRARRRCAPPPGCWRCSIRPSWRACSPTS